MQSSSQIITTTNHHPAFCRPDALSVTQPTVLLLCRPWQKRRLSATFVDSHDSVKQAVQEAATLCRRPCKLTYDLLTLKVVSESRVTWATSGPILVFLGLAVLDLGPMYATDSQTSDAHHRLMPPPYGGGGIIMHQLRYS